MTFRKITFSLYFVLFLTTSAVSATAYEHELAVATIFQDEAPFLREWIEYYKLMGVSRFYLYNNLSEDDYLDVLEPYIESSEVKLTDWPFESTNIDDYRQVQLDAYQDALEQTVGKVKWLMVIDTDEFFVPTKKNNLIEFLAKFEKKSKIGGIEALWVYFGTSGVQKIPDNMLMTETLLLNQGPSDSKIRRQHKSIIRPERVLSFENCHNANYVPGYSHKTISIKDLQVNHYWTRDEFYLHQVKIPRREKWGTSVEGTLKLAKNMIKKNSYSKPILRFVKPLKKQIQLK